MAKIIPTKYRYPMFFAGITIMAAAGFADRYAHLGLGLTATCAAAGFLLFVASIALP
ncbi:MAG: hypothetical protein KGI06_01500 [Candidatus Micrarchaeota archaeon]|nr:hypothetical protein [Candidatus Micrarchaeota archaeon]